MPSLPLILLITFGADAGQQPKIPPDCLVPGLGRFLKTLQLTSDGRWLVSMDERDSRRRLTCVRDPSKQYQLPRRFGSHAVSSDGRWMYNETDEGYALFDIDTTDEPALIERLGNKAISWIEYSRDNRYFTVTRGDTKESWLLDAARPIAKRKTFPSFYLVTDRWRVETVGGTRLSFTSLVGDSPSISLTLPADAKVIRPETASVCDARYSFPMPGDWSKQYRWIVVVEPALTRLIDLAQEDPVTTARTLKQTPQQFRCARVAPDGSWLAFLQPESIVICDAVKDTRHVVDTGGSLELRPQYEQAFSYTDKTGFQRSHDARWLSYVGMSLTNYGMGQDVKHIWRLWDLAGDSPSPVLGCDHEIRGFGGRAMWQFAYSLDSRWLLELPAYGDAHLWDLSKPVAYVVPERIGKVPLRLSAVSDDGRFAAHFNTGTGGLTVWYLDSGGKRPTSRTIAELDAKTHFLKFVPKSNLLLGVVPGGILTSWNLDLEDPVPVRLGRHIPEHNEIGFSLLRRGDLVVMKYAFDLRYWSVRAEEPTVTDVHMTDYYDGLVIDRQDGIFRLRDIDKPEVCCILDAKDLKWAIFASQDKAIMANNKNWDVLIWNVGNLLNSAKMK